MKTQNQDSAQKRIKVIVKKSLYQI